MNKKSLRTQEQLETALFKLLRSTPYDDLSITAITAEAGVSRAAFYRNYTSKGMILDTFIQREYDAFTQDVQNHKHANLSELLTVYVGYFYDHPWILKDLLHAGLDATILNKQTAYFIQFVHSYYAPDYLTDYDLAYYSGGTFMFLHWWVKNDYQLSVTEVVAILVKKFAVQTN